MRRYPDDEDEEDTEVRDIFLALILLGLVVFAFNYEFSDEPRQVKQTEGVEQNDVRGREQNSNDN